ncbi:hypothetical protein [Mesorhizobium sp. B2-8-3]|nr:hypothetical protein [Mesorhizobium sp. B2-8-3]
MCFTLVLFCWAAFFGWDLAANDGEFVLAIGHGVFRLIRMTGLV